MSKNADRIKELAQPFLDDGEQILAALTAAPRGKTTQMAAGGIGSMIGASQAGKNVKAAAGSGIVVSGSMAVVLTTARLLTLKVKISATGQVTEVREVLSAIPRSAIESMEAKRFGLGGVLTITVPGGEPVKLECKVGDAREIADAFAGATA